MGLDNSICLHTRKPINQLLLPDWLVGNDVEDYPDKAFFPMTERKGDYEYEIVYFRKAWCFRAAVYKYVEKPEDKDCGEFDLSPAAIPKIRDELYHFLCSPEEWDDGNQVFYMSESKWHIAQEILNLTWLERYLKEDPTAYITFVDSW